MAAAEGPMPALACAHAVCMSLVCDFGVCVCVCAHMCVRACVRACACTPPTTRGQDDRLPHEQPIEQAAADCGVLGLCALAPQVGQDVVRLRGPRKLARICGAAGQAAHDPKAATA